MDNLYIPLKVSSWPYLGKQGYSVEAMAPQIYLFIKFIDCPPYHKVTLGSLWANLQNASILGPVTPKGIITASLLLTAGVVLGQFPTYSHNPLHPPILSSSHLPACWEEKGKGRFPMLLTRFTQGKLMGRPAESWQLTPVPTSFFAHH